MTAIRTGGAGILPQPPFVLRLRRFLDDCRKRFASIIRGPAFEMPFVFARRGGGSKAAPRIGLTAVFQLTHRYLSARYVIAPFTQLVSVAAGAVRHTRDWRTVVVAGAERIRSAPSRTPARDRASASRPLQRALSTSPDRSTAGLVSKPRDARSAATVRTGEPRASGDGMSSRVLHSQVMRRVDTHQTVRADLLRLIHERLAIAAGNDGRRHDRGPVATRAAAAFADAAIAASSGSRRRAPRRDGDVRPAARQEPPATRAASLLRETVHLRRFASAPLIVETARRWQRPAINRSAPPPQLTSFAEHIASRLSTVEERHEHAASLSYVFANRTHHLDTTVDTRSQRVEHDESFVKRVQRQVQEEAGRLASARALEAPSPEELTDHIYERLTRRLQIEKERLGY